MFFIRMFAVPLAVTVFAEILVALLWGFRNARDLLTVLWINAVTNPAVTALRYLSNQVIDTGSGRTAVMIILELCVLLAEWRLFRRFLRHCRHPFVFSLVMNAASFGAGFLIPVVLQSLSGSSSMKRS